LLGYTPHYSNSGNIEEQSKVHLSYHGLDMSKAYQKLGYEDVYEVTLEEGDILYHPAGIWH
jgi:ribosomal protein L16 Arg81 hydroxylase